MGWRACYETLTELFPQVDKRLIKGAALEHGDDVAAAAEFILNDILGGPDDWFPEYKRETTDTVPKNSLEDLHRKLSQGHATTVPPAFDTFSLRPYSNPVRNWGQEEQGVRSVRSRVGQGSSAFTEAEAQDQTGVYPDEIPAGVVTTEEIGVVEFEVPSSDSEVSSGASRKSTEDGVEVSKAHEIDELSFDSKVFDEFLSEFRSTAVQESTSNSIIFLEAMPSEVVENTSEVRNIETKSEPAICDPITPPVTLSEKVNSTSSEDVGPVEVVHVNIINDETALEFPVGESGTLSNLNGERLDSRGEESTSQVQQQEEFFEEAEESETATKTSTGYRFSLVDELLESAEVVRSAHEEEEETLDDTVGDNFTDKSSSTMFTQKCLAFLEEMDKTGWEKVSGSSMFQIDQMEPLDALVEEAKVDKEALISSIEEIRVLRLMTDQAEFAARQSREEAARGGLDVMATVKEMRKMLSLAREANAVHAGEVFGEKAVLATEARELQYRLMQVNVEKAKAVAALNEIKASLQSRIESAVRERAAADLEKAEKEKLAKEALAKEEALVTKVAQESKDLDEEAEACAKIRDFLVERGSIIDALQGEVAVLREDAEALKKDLESMSLSCGGSQIHTLSQAGSEIYCSNNSIFGTVTGGNGQASDSLVEIEDGAVSSGGNSVVSVRSVSDLQNSTSEKKSWSSLPSLLRGLTGSQLYGSQDLTRHSSSGSDLLNSIRDAVLVNNGELLTRHSSSSDLLNSIRDAVLANNGEESPSLGLENVTDIQYPSSPSSTTSPGAAQAERELLKAKMEMFPEDLMTDYSSIQNLDVFRTENSNKSGAMTDEEDWQVLETASSRSSSSSRGK